VGERGKIKIRKNGLSSQLRCCRYLLGESQLPLRSAQNHFGRAATAHPCRDASVVELALRAGRSGLPAGGGGG